MPRIFCLQLANLCTILRVAQPNPCEANQPGRGQRPAGGERIHRGRKKETSLWNTLQGGSGRDSKGETVWQEAVVRGYTGIGWSEVVWELVDSFLGGG